MSKTEMPEIKRNIIDKVVSYINPVKGAERFKARAFMAVAGNAYNGSSKTRRQMKEYNTRIGDADADSINDLTELRSRSRDLYRNSPFATGALKTVVTNVIGTGLKLNSRIDNEFLNISDDEKAKLERQIEFYFSMWAKSKKCDITHSNNFYELQSLSFFSTLLSGDVFTVLKKKERNNWPFKLALQLIEADRISTPNDKKSDKTIVDGIKKDSNGEPIKYYISEKHPGDFNNFAKNNKWQEVPVFGTGSGRRNILHLFSKERPGQTRGIPYLASVIEPLKQLDRYTEAELMAAVISGMFTVFIKTENGESGNLSIDLDEGTSSKEEQGEVSMGNGTVVDLAENESIDTANPGRPNTAFDPFVMAILRQIGVALELPFEVLIKHYQSSYSAARASILDAWKFFRQRRKWQESNFCQPVYEEFFDELVSKGIINAPGYFNDPFVREAYLGAEWIGPSRGMIKEKEEVEAGILKVNAGFATQADVTAEITGTDYNKNYKTMVKENKDRVRDGLKEPIAISEDQNDNEENDNEETNNEENDNEETGFDMQAYKTSIDAFGIGVRGGAITPQKADEEHFRSLAGLPEVSEDIDDAWEKDGGTRRPVTLKSGTAFEAEQEKEAEINEEKPEENNEENNEDDN